MSRNRTPRFTLTNTKMEYLEHVRENVPLQYSGIKPLKSDGVVLGRPCSLSACYQLYSLTDLSLSMAYGRWYAHGGKKSVPVDLKLSPISVLHWFYGDGSTNFENHQYATCVYSAIQTKLATNDFTKSDCERLSAMLRSHGMRFSLYLQAGGWVLKSASLSTAIALYRYIICAHQVVGLRCFDYKFKLPWPSKKKTSNNRVMQDFLDMHPGVHGIFARPGLGRKA